MKWKIFLLAGVLAIQTGGGPAQAYDKDKASDRAALKARAYAECRKPQYARDVKIKINYAKGWFHCEEPEWYNGKGQRKR